MRFPAGEIAFAVGTRGVEAPLENVARHVDGATDHAIHGTLGVGANVDQTEPASAISASASSQVRRRTLLRAWAEELVDGDPISAHAHLRGATRSYPLRISH